jgi:hypothetical protein
MNQGAVNWDARIFTLENVLRSLPTKHTFRFNLGDGAYFIWTQRFNRSYGLVLSTPNSMTNKNDYCPMCEANYGDMERYGPQLLGFFTRMIEYCDLEPVHLW